MHEKLALSPFRASLEMRKLMFPLIFSEKHQRAVDEAAAASQQRKLLEILSAIDKVQKSTNSRLVPKNTGHHGNYYTNIINSYSDTLPL